MVKKRKKRILFVEQNQDGTIGGSHYCLFNLIDALDRNKYEPLVMFYEFNKNLEHYYNKYNAVIYRKPLGKNFNPPFSSLNVPFLVFRKCYNFFSCSIIPFVKFSIFIIKNRVDVIHLNNSANVGWEWLISGKLLKRKCITHQRGNPKISRLVRIGAALFDSIICMSQSTEKYMNENGVLRRTITIYDGMDPQEFQKRIKRPANLVRKEYIPDDSSFLIGMVGNFQEWKGQFTVVQAVSLLVKKYPTLVCLLIGDVSRKYRKDSEYFARIRQEVRERSLENNVVITGYRSDIPELMNALDILIHASTIPEPFGMVVLEGMCLKKPVIATNIGGPTEIIENGVSGILVPPGDPTALAEKIEYLLEDPELREKIGGNAFKRVEEKFSLEEFSSQINKFYKDFLHLAP
jgi:glycosyltransferase involved in cell wall biosynthesis